MRMDLGQQAILAARPERQAHIHSGHVARRRLHAKPGEGRLGRRRRGMGLYRRTQGRLTLRNAIRVCAAVTASALGLLVP